MDSQIQRIHANHLGTKSPNDVFIVVMEYINLVNKQSSPSLQRRVFSAALVEISMFCNAVCDDLMKHWATAPSEVAMDYVCAVMNDTAAILDRLEQIESSFSSICVAEQARRRGALSCEWNMSHHNFTVVWVLLCRREPRETTAVRE
jgi:hypothetical protein